MASVAQLVRSGDSYMKFIDYTSTYKDNNREFLRGDMWEFSFINAPKIVYYPGDTIFKARLNQVNVSIDTSVQGFEKMMRGGYTLFQKTNQMTSGTLNLSFVDKEDQAITYFIDDWRQKISDRDTKYSFRKDDVVSDCMLVLTNSSRIKVRTLKFYNCIIADASTDESGHLESTSDRSDVNVSMNFEHYERTFDNL